jgi:HAD superfamily hydrolase (TIGR01549 family)
MDDTIFDHSLTCRAAIARLRRTARYLSHRTVDELWAEYARQLDRDFGEILAGRLSIAGARTRRWASLAEQCGVHLGLEGAADLSRRYRQYYQELRRPVPGALPLLRRLHGTATIGVITNNEVAEQQEKLRFLGAEPYVDLLVVSEEVGVPKPDPRIFRTALERASVEPEEAVMVGDSWSSDVVGALGVGVRPVWFNRFRLPRPEPRPIDELRSLAPAAGVEAVLVRPRHPSRRTGSPRSGQIKSRAPLPRR